MFLIIYQLLIPCPNSEIVPAPPIPVNPVVPTVVPAVEPESESETETESESETETDGTESGTENGDDIEGGTESDVDPDGSGIIALAKLFGLMFPAAGGSFDTKE